MTAKDREKNMFGETLPQAWKSDATKGSVKEYSEHLKARNWSLAGSAMAWRETNRGRDGPSVESFSAGKSEWTRCAESESGNLMAWWETNQGEKWSGEKSCSPGTPE